MALATPLTDPGSDALDVLIAREEASLLARTTQSHELHATACASLAGGVASSWQDAPPCPVWISHGKGSRVWDVDGNEYVDLHGGFGTMVVGHAHPAIVEAVSRRVGRRHPLRPAGARPDPRLGRARPALRAAVVALRQLRHRGHDGRPAPDAGRHRSPADHQGRGQLPRSPRRRAGLGLSGGRSTPGRPTGPARFPNTSPCRRSLAASTHVVPFGRLDAVQPDPARPSRRDRGHDHRAGDDEHRRHPAAATATCRRSPTCSTPTARCSRSTR